MINAIHGFAGRVMLLVALCGVTLGHAATPIDERHPLAADGRLTIGNVAGEVRLSAWDEEGVALSGSLGNGAQELRVSGDAGRLDVQVVPRKNNRDQEPTLLIVQLPRGVAVDVEVVSADVQAEGLAGALKIESVSGDIDARVASRSLELRSVSGDIHVEAPSQDTLVHSVSGDVTARGLGGRLALETMSGSVTLACERFERVDLKTISGDVDARLALAGRAVLTGESLSGNLRLHLPAATAATMRFNTFSGDIDSGFGGAVDTAQRKGFELRVNDGGAQVELSSFSGDIAVLPQ